MRNLTHPLTPEEKRTTFILGLWTLLILAFLVAIGIRASATLFPGDIGIGFGVGAGSWGGPYSGLGIGFGSGGRSGYYGGFYGSPYYPYHRSYSHYYYAPVDNQPQYQYYYPQRAPVYYQDAQGNIWSSQGFDQNGGYTLQQQAVPSN